MGEGLFSTLVRLGGHDQHQTSQCASQPKVPPHGDPPLKALQLTEALRALLADQGSHEEQDILRRQVSGDTAQMILEWLARDEVSAVSHQSRHTNITPDSTLHHLTLVHETVLHHVKDRNSTSGKSTSTSSPSDHTSEVCAGCFDTYILRQKHNKKMLFS